jgi:hypothetical protein
MAPATVCVSEVQMSAAVVLMTASFGPGAGSGFSITSTWPIFFMTNAFIVCPISISSGG